MLTINGLIIVVCRTRLSNQNRYGFCRFRLLKLLILDNRPHENTDKPLKQMQPGKTEDDVRSTTS
jgi:hypothetical protein